MPDPLTDPTDIRRYSNALRIQSERRIEALTQQLIDGKIDLAKWQGDMKAELRRANYEQFVMGKGGDRSKIVRTEYLQLGPELKHQYAYLQRFAEEIARRADDGKSIQFALERAKLYARSTQAMMWRSAIPVKLPQVPRDGKTRCRTNCKCRLETKQERDDSGAVTAILVYWKLRPAEHCFPAGTMILTDSGEKPIESIALGDMVMTRFGLKKVTKLFQRPLTGALIRVSSQAHSVLCTPNHPFLTTRDWVEAQDLVSGDYAMLFEGGYQQVHTEIRFPDANHCVTAGGQVSILGLVSGLLLDLPLAQWLKARMSVPPVAVRLDDQVSDAHIHNKLGLDQEVRLVLNSKFIQHSKQPQLKFGRLITLKSPVAFEQFFEDIRSLFAALTHAFKGVRLLAGIVLTHIFGSLIMDQAVRRLFVQRQPQPVRFILDLVTRAINMLRYFIRSHAGVVGAQKFHFRFTPVAILGIVLGAIGRFSAAAIVPADRTPNPKNFGALAAIESISAGQRAKPRSRVIEFFSALFTFLHRNNPPQTLYPKLDVQQVYNLEVEEVHEYVANGFVVHNCEDCIKLSREWNPLRMPVEVSEAATMDQAVGLLLDEAHDEITPEEAEIIRAMWEVEVWELH